MKKNMSNFDGATYNPALDKDRLKKQLGRVFEQMSGGEWLTLEELSRATRASEASVSARIRDLRKERFGGHRIERRRRGTPEGGLFEYRMVGQIPAIFNAFGQGEFAVCCER